MRRLIALFKIMALEFFRYGLSVDAHLAERAGDLVLKSDSLMRIAVLDRQLATLRLNRSLS